MRFLNVYPKRLLATLNEAGAFEGQLTFDLEQYGLINTGVVSDVLICENKVMAGEWMITLKPLFDIEMPHFDKFVKALNHYVFEVLQLMPNRTASGQELPTIKLFFDDMYFDMSGVDPVIQKVSPEAKQK
jgi:hypothetical protein